MRGSVRVNLSVPVPVDEVLSEMANMTGRTKAAVIMEAVGWFLTDWKRQIRRERTLLYQENQRLKPLPTLGRPPSVTNADRSAEADTASKGGSLTPQEEWNLKLAQEKAAKTKANRG